MRQPVEIPVCVAETPTGVCGLRAWRLVDRPDTDAYLPICNNDAHIPLVEGVKVIPLSQMLFLGVL